MDKSKKKTADNQEKNNNFLNQSGNKKTATNNQWVSTGLARPNNHERRDGPGGENADK